MISVVYITLFLYPWIPTFVCICNVWFYSLPMGMGYGYGSTTCAN